MNSRNFLLRQIVPVAIGQSLCVAAMVGIFALAGKFDMTVLWGGIAGGLISLANFFFMSLFANLAADKAVNQDVAGGQKLIQLSYMGRMIAMLIALVVCAKSGFFNVLALALPLLFIRPILTVTELFKKKGGN